MMDALDIKGVEVGTVNLYNLQAHSFVISQVLL